MSRNLLNIIFTKLVFLILAFASFNVFSQLGTPFLTNYSPHNYKGHPQIWCMVQDKFGMIYFGNSPGVLQYDGVSWRMIKNSNGSISRSLAVGRNGKIYVGCQSDVGYLEPDEIGNLKYVSLLDSIPSDYRDFEDVWRTYAAGTGIFFQTNKYLFRWHDKKMKVWKPQTEFHLAYEVFDWIYITERNTGLKQVVGDTLYMVSNGEFFNDKRIYTMMPYKTADILIGTREHGLFVYDGIKPIPLKSNINEFLITHQLYAGVKLPNGNYSIATIRKGGVSIDASGNLVSILNRTMGLRDDNVYSLFVDGQDGLWMGLGNGVSRVEASSPVSVFNDASGLKGSVESIIRHNGVLYVATHQGVYCLNEKIKINDVEKGEAEYFDDVEGIRSQSWGLVSTNNIYGTNDPMLIAATSDGVYQINEKKSTNIFKATAISIHQSKAFPERIFVGLSTGVATMYYDNSRWVYDGLLVGITKPIHMIRESDNGQIWFATKFEGAFKADFSTGFLKNPPFSYYDSTSGLPKGRLNLFTLKEDVVFATPKGLYRFNDDLKLTTKKFSLDTSLGKTFADGSRDVFYVFEDKNGNVWMNTGDENRVAVLKRNGSYRWDDKPFKRIPKSAIWAIYAEESITWLGGPDGLICYEKKSVRNFIDHYPTLIRKVILSNDSVIFYGTYYRELNEKKFNPRSFHQDTDKQDYTIEYILEKEKIATLNQTEKFIPGLPYKFNSLTFEYASPRFDNSKENSYQFFLEGYESDWSNWTELTTKEYTNLNEGKYKFHVRSIDIYGQKGKEAVYEFQIEPPWYRTNWAYASYAWLFIIFIWTTLQLSISRIKSAKIRLQKIIDQRTEEILIQKDKLESINLELEKLSLVASKTDNPVLILDADGTVEYVNDTFTRISGYTLDDLYKKFGNTIFEVSTHNKIKEAYSESISFKRSVKYETINVKKDGGYLWMSSTLTPVIGNDGSIKKFLIIDTDITERKHNEEIINQKNKDITDSITYAKRIQDALLPLDKNIKSTFPDSFILYKPKDIVSGDFYWFTTIHQNKENSSAIIAACDCTGHGVPGAFMSMIGNDLLNQVVLGNKVYKPSIILDKLHEGIRFVLKHDEGEIETRDGFDIALCKIDWAKNTLEFAGAHRPLYLIRNQRNEVEIVKADKVGIGDDAIEKSRSFCNHEIKFNMGDIIYLFSDGFTDQIGGPKNKKYKSSKFRDFLLNIKEKKMDTQKQLLLEEMKKWIGNEPQTDDILVIGIRF